MSEERGSIMSDEEQATEGAKHLRVAQRAYELYEKRGREDGYEHQDWLQAEQEVLRLPSTDPPDESITGE